MKPLKNTVSNYYPEAVQYPFDGIEINAVREYKENGKTFCEPVFGDEEKQADFWAVYIHHKNPGQHGALACIADLPTEAEAKAMEYHCRRLSKTNLIAYLTRTINRIITDVDGSRGAPMGRPNVGVPPSNKKIYDCFVPMCGAYDKGGAYWGIGKPLRVSYTKDLSYIEFYRQKPI